MVALISQSRLYLCLRSIIMCIYNTGSSNAKIIEMSRMFCLVIPYILSGVITAMRILLETSRPNRCYEALNFQEGGGALSMHLRMQECRSLLYYIHDTRILNCAWRESKNHFRRPQSLCPSNSGTLVLKIRGQQTIPSYPSPKTAKLVDKLKTNVI